jgi:hippurate hydrolase
MVERALPSLLGTYRSIHAAPELSHYEEKTSDLVARELRALGYTVTERVGKYETAAWKGYGITGVLRNGSGPVVLVRAELDALPIEEKTGLPYASRVRTKNALGQDVSVMHACGHDLHLTAMLGTARMLVDLKDRWSGTLVLVGEPAEETLDGVRAMIDDGLYQKVPSPDYVLALHSLGELEAGKVGLISGAALASVQLVEVVIRGIGGHASRPDLGKDPVVLAAQTIMALQTIVSRENSALEPAGITIGSIHGGTSAGIIPDEVVLLLSVRALSEEVRQKHVRTIERIVQGMARAAGIPDDRLPVIRVSETGVTPATYNDPSLTERLAGVFSKQLGPSNVVRLGPRMAGETFGGYGSAAGRRVPSSWFLLGVADPEDIKRSQARNLPLPTTHSPLFAPRAEPALRTGIIAMTSAVLDLLSK